MAVAARFRITQITKFADYQGDGAAGLVELSAAVGTGNEDWARYTPNGRIEMHVNGGAFPWFEDRLGDVLALTFDELPDEPTTA